MAVWQEIVDYTVPSNATSVVLDDFGTITKDDFIKIVFTLIDVSTGVSIQLFPNNNTTSTNYHTQRLYGIGSTAAALRTNNAFVFNAEGQVDSVATAYLKLSENDRVNVFVNDTMSNNSNVINRFWYMTSSNATFTGGITSLTFAGNANIGTGSRIQIYKLTATKVADITVSANATQVDIEDLNITKDSEYLLVSDISYVFDVNLLLTVNDNTTDTNYYGQRIYASSSTTLPERKNSARIGGSPTKSLSYHHIKLSNIGAYTSQNYTMREYGTTTPQIDNWFNSSVAENITSITKLNIIGQNASPSIAAGTRFMLYKLY